MQRHAAAPAGLGSSGMGAGRPRVGGSALFERFRAF